MRKKRTLLKRIVTIMLTIVMSVSCNVPTLAVTSDELLQQKKEAENQKKNSEKKLDSLQGDIEELSEEMEAAEEELAILDEQLVDLLLTVDLLQGDIDLKKEAIAQAEVEYEEAVARVEAQQEAMRRRIKFMYEKGNQSYLEILIESKSMAEAINKVEYSEKLYAYDRFMLEQYQMARQDVVDKQIKLENDLNELEEIEADYEVEKEALNALIAEKQETVEGFDARLSSARAVAKQYEQEIKSQTENLKKISEQQKIVAAEEARKKAEEEARRKAEEAAKKKAAEDAANIAKSRMAAEAASENKGEIVVEASENSEQKDNAGATENNGEASTNSDNSNDTTSAESSSTQTSSSGTSVRATGSGKGADIANYALQFVGNPYVPGGTSLTNGADCSGFTQTVYSNFGIKIPRSSYSQSEGGVAVDYANAQAGDIIYYGGHVAIYIGNDQIVHASTPSSGIKISSAFYRSIVTVRRYY